MKPRNIGAFFVYCDMEIMAEKFTHRVPCIPQKALNSPEMRGDEAVENWYWKRGKKALLEKINAMENVNIINIQWEVEGYDDGSEKFTAYVTYKPTSGTFISI